MVHPELTKEKNMNKVNSKKIMYYVLLVGVLALIVAYFLVYRKYNYLTEQLNSDNHALSDRVAVLKEYYDNRSMYEEAIAAMTGDINNKLDDFPTDVKEEDILMLAVDTLKYNAIAYTNIAVSDREPIYEIDRGIVGAAKIEGLSDTLTFVERSVNFVNDVDYYNLKNVIGQIMAGKNKKVLAVVSYTANDKSEETEEVNEDNLYYLNGTLTLHFFSVLGTGKPYVRPDIPDYDAGLHDLFGFNTIQSKENGL